MKYKEYINSISKTIRTLGVHKGDILYIASDATKIVKTAQNDLGAKSKSDRETFLNELIDMLQQLVGEDGTLLFPVFNWDFCKGETFDYKKTQGKVGALNNFVLNNRGDFKRTRHAIYSFMVWGKDQNMLCAMDNQEAFGTNSPFAYLRNNDAKQLTLGTDVAKGITYFHFVEQQLRVPYRHQKFFMGKYVDEFGNVENRVYSQFVRDISINYEFVLSDEFLEREKAIRISFCNGWKVSLANLTDIHCVIKTDILDGAKNIYYIEGYDVKEHMKEKDGKYEINYLKDGVLI